MKKNKLFKIIPVFMAIFAFSLSGCSYVMDYVEGRITNRAAFSIDASYNSTDKTVTIEWDESGSGDDFAGYELYITEERDDEYVGYNMVVSMYEDTADNIVPVNTLSSLSLKSTDSFIIDVSGIANDPDLAGIYFFRIGIIDWDETDEDDRIDDYDSYGCVFWSDEPCRERNYYAETDIYKISGYTMVEIR